MRAAAVILAACASCAANAADGTFIDRAVLGQREATAYLRAAEARGDKAGVERALDALRGVDLATAEYFVACPLVLKTEKLRPGCTAPQAEGRLAVLRKGLK